MADIRIKDLTTEAPTSLTGDFLPIDGGTGTRKLSAYSPTFGGNATVGGTLTVSGSGTTAIGGMVKGAAATYSSNPPTGVTSGFQVDVENATTRDVISFGDTSRAGLLRGYHDGSGGINWRFGRYSAGAYDEFARLAGSTAASAILTIYGTTASTSTSSGALVVGNGTSGGLGVGGAINAGGIIGTTDVAQRITNTSGAFQIYKDGTPSKAARFSFNTAATDTVSLGVYNGSSWTDTLRVTDSAVTSMGDLRVTENGKGVYSQGYVTVKGLQANYFARGTNGGWTAGLHFYSSNTDVSASIFHNPATGDLQFYTTASASDYNLTTDRALVINTSKQVQVLASTASTNTSSGALVVSGGVGVAKEVYVGTTLKLANTSRSVAAWGDIGAQLSVAGAVITDTSSSGTVSRAVVNSIAASALAASSTTTYTQAASLFVAGAPTANTNVTITNAYAIYTAGGRINFQGLPTSSAGLQAGTLWNDGGTLKVA